MPKAPLKLFLVLSLFVLPDTSGRADTLELMAFERAPYYVDQHDGTYEGLIASPASSAFEKAGIAFKWVKTPAKRQLKVLKDNKKEVCGLGWFKKQDRETFAKFTTVLYQDHKMGALVKKGGKLSGSISTPDLIGNHAIKMGHKMGFSYGPHFDAAVEHHAPRKVETTRGIAGLISMLEGERFDYMLIAAEEAQPLLAAHPALAWLEISDSPEGNKRYILCSQKVPDTTIAKLNAAIKG